MKSECHFKNIMGTSLWLTVVFQRILISPHWFSNDLVSPGIKPLFDLIETSICDAMWPQWVNESCWNQLLLVSQASTRANPRMWISQCFLTPLSSVHMKPGALSRHTDFRGSRQDDSTAAPTVDGQLHLLANLAILLDINCQAEKKTRFTKENKSRLVMQMSCKVVTVICNNSGATIPIHSQRGSAPTHSPSDKYHWILLMGSQHCLR